MSDKKLNYGNWVPLNMIRLLWGVSGIWLVIILANGFVFQNIIGGIISICLFVVFAGMSIYMQICRNVFSFEKGGLMGQIHDFILNHMQWDGQGKLLDIGCGAGALSIKCAKKYPLAAITGVDYWGSEWNYAKEQCESNAKIEGVEKQIIFQKGDAAQLDFADETFDAAVSNFVFHEVRSQPVKQLVVREALRVVKKGGVFVFHDMFEQKKLYGDMNAFIEQLRKEGITEIHYIANTEKETFIPDFLSAPWMLKNMGLIYGVK